MIYYSKFSNFRNLRVPGQIRKKGREYVKKIFLLWVIVSTLLIFSGCTQTTGMVENNQSLNSGLCHHDFSVLAQKLADKLAAGIGVEKVGRIAVASLGGPGVGVTGLGEHLGDKLGVAMFETGKFPDLMERRQLKKVLEAQSIEQSGYFDQQTVARYGGLIGVESMVIGTIKDLGSYFDVTVRIVDVKSGHIAAVGEERLAAGKISRELAEKRQQATLTIKTAPAVQGKIIVAGRSYDLADGLAVVNSLPFGSYPVLINARGFKEARQSINVKNSCETLTVNLESELYSISLQISPPSADCTIDGDKIKLNNSGFARVEKLEAGTHIFRIAAKDYKCLTEKFDPSRESDMIIELEANNSYTAFTDSIAKKVKKIESSFPAKVRVWTDKPNYRLGEEITFHVQVVRDCYLNLININPNGDLTLLFPNQHHPDNFVHAGQTLNIPENYYGFRLKIQPPCGFENVYALASDRPINIFDPDFKNETFHAMTRSGTRGVGVEAVQNRLDKTLLKGAAAVKFETW